MKKVLKKKAGIDIPCYVDKNSIQKLIDRTMSFGLNEAFEHNITPAFAYDDNYVLELFFMNKKSFTAVMKKRRKKYLINTLGSLQILAPMIQNPNPSRFGWTLIYEAVVCGNVKLIEILAPILEDPIEPNPG